MTGDAAAPGPSVPPEDRYEPRPGPPPGVRLEDWLGSIPLDDAIRHYELLLADERSAEIQHSLRRIDKRTAGQAIARRLHEESGRAPRVVGGITYWPHKDGHGLERRKDGKRGGPKE